MEKDFLRQFVENERVFNAVRKYFDEQLDTRVTEQDNDKAMSEFIGIIQGKIYAHKMVNDLFRELLKLKSQPTQESRENPAR